MKMPPLLADFTHARPCKPFCEKYLTLPALRVGSTTMQAATGVPTSVSDIIQALVIVFTVAGLAMVKLPEFRAAIDRAFAKNKEVA